jgi:hypothetical protein
MTAQMGRDHHGRFGSPYERACWQQCFHNQCHACMPQPCSSKEMMQERQLHSRQTSTQPLDCHWLLRTRAYSTLAISEDPEKHMIFSQYVTSGSPFLESCLGSGPRRPHPNPEYVSQAVRLFQSHPADAYPWQCSARAIYGDHTFPQASEYDVRMSWSSASALYCNRAYEIVVDEPRNDYCSPNCQRMHLVRAEGG